MSSGAYWWTEKCDRRFGNMSDKYKTCLLLIINIAFMKHILNNTFICGVYFFNLIIFMYIFLLVLRMQVYKTKKISVTG